MDEQDRRRSVGSSPGGHSGSHSSGQELQADAPEPLDGGERHILLGADVAEEGPLRASTHRSPPLPRRTAEPPRPQFRAVGAAQHPSHATPLPFVTSTNVTRAERGALFEIERPGGK
jgi:hypothetical protein